MTDRELLEAMYADLHVVKDDVQNIKSDMQNMKSDIQNMKSDIQNMKSDIQNMKSDIQNMKSKISHLEDRLVSLEQRTDAVERKVASISLILENETNHSIQLLAENHISLVNKLNDAIKVQDKSILYEVQVSSLNMKVEHLEKEVAEIKSQIA